MISHNHYEARSRALIISLAAALAVLAGSGGSGTNTPSATSPIAIGYELPLTGTAALPGKQEQEGWNLGLKEFGQTVAGHRIVTYFEDTGGNPGRRAVRRPLAGRAEAHPDYGGPAAVARALKTTPITAPRGPVQLNTLIDAPIQNIYICKVQSVHGTLEDVPIKTYPDVEPWGTLPYHTWRQEFTTDSTGRPPV